MGVLCKWGFQDEAQVYMLQIFFEGIVGIYFLSKRLPAVWKHEACLKAQKYFTRWGQSMLLFGVPGLNFKKYLVIFKENIFQLLDTMSWEEIKTGN